MVLALALESLDAVDESLHSQYAEKDGMFVLQTEPGMGYTVEKDISKLTKALEAEKHEASTLRGKLKDFEGIETKYKTQIEKLSDAEPNEKAKKQHEAQIAELAQKHQLSEAEWQKQLNEEKAYTAKLMIDDQVIKEFVAQGGKPDTVDFYLPSARAETDVRVDDQGRRNVVVLGDNDVARIGGTDGTPMSIAQLVSEHKANPKYQVFFNAENAVGGGATPSNGNGGQGQKMTLANFEKLEGAEQHDFVANGGIVT